VNYFARTALLLSNVLWLSACQPNPPSDTADIDSTTSGVAISQTINFNQQWQFTKADENGQPPADSWQTVQLPHTPNLEPEVVNDQWQGIAWYKKTFDAPASWHEKTVLLRFEAAMNVATVWLNDQQLGEHMGGYLPFTLDLTPYLQPGSNTLTVKLDNQDNPLTGPKPLELLDFNTYGGLYRGVSVMVKDPLHITDEILADIPAGGGIFVTYPQVSEDVSRVNIKTHVANQSATPATFTLVQTLENKEQTISQQTQYTLEPGQAEHLEQQLTVEQARLWSPTQPNLYTLTTELRRNNELVERQQRKIGIREFAFNENHELLINGEKTFLRGVNRHQEYPFVGYAISPQADYRDAVKIKSAGFDYVRLSHYPHSPAFMQAADELGLVLLNAVLGWQFYNADPAFEANIIDSCADLIRRDRNHASVIAWECSLNESDMPDEFIATLHNTVKTEYPGAFSAGWEKGYDIFVQARQHRLQHYSTPNQPYIVSEYGDWEYYAQNAGLNQDAWEGLKEEERTSRQLLNSGEKRLLQQALNLQEAHNDNFTVPAFADGYWVMFDYNRGYADDIESSGIMSLYRQPKYSYYLFQSQRSAKEVDNRYTSGPMVFIASDWQADSSPTVRVFSNAEQVKLYLNDTLIAQQTPDTDALSSHLAHPPFTFKLAGFEAGTLRAEALIDNQVVATHSVATASAPSQIALRIDESGMPVQEGVKDVVFVYAQLLDANGNPAFVNNIELSASSTGDITILNQSPITTARGEAALLIEAGQQLSGATVTVSGPGLAAATLTF
jgi:beta-galactosidase